MQALPGFRDFLPEDCARRNYIFGKWREVARRYGFVEYDGPVLEELELFKKKSGEEISKQLYEFTDKGGRAVALRPEMTPTLARLVAANQRDFRKPMKWFCISQMFRYERQQRGRLREHYQFNADILGEDSVEADIELIALCVDVLRAFGFTAEDVVIRISDREFWTDFFRAQNVTEDRWQHVLEVVDKSERAPRAKTAEALGDLAPAVFQILDGGGQSDKLDGVMVGLRQRGLADFASVDLRIVRGLAYYTGVVFEAFDRGGNLRAIAGGGRYNNLVAHLSDGALALPALGFAMGDVVLGELIKENSAALLQMNNTSQSDLWIEVYVLIAKEERREIAMRIVQDLRDAKFRVGFSFVPEKVGAQFRRAEALGGRYVVIVGDEWPQVAVKNLSSGEQRLMAHEELLAHLTS